MRTTISVLVPVETTGTGKTFMQRADVQEDVPYVSYFVKKTSTTSVYTLPWNHAESDMARRQISRAAKVHIKMRFLLYDKQHMQLL